MPLRRRWQVTPPVCVDHAGLPQNSYTCSFQSRYRSRNAAHIVWEVIAQYEGIDGLPYGVLRNLSDQTWHKTMSQTELERGEQYSLVPEGFQAK
jgi:hypothetical protein